MEFHVDAQNGRAATHNPVVRNATAGSSVRILGHYVKDFSFVSPKGPINARADQPTLQLDLGMRHDRIDAAKHELAVQITGQATAGGETMYEFKLVFAGMFEFTSMTEDQVKAVLNVNCPAILFPYYRQILGDMTRAGGFAPVWLDPIDWGKIYADRLDTDGRPS